MLRRNDPEHEALEAEAAAFLGCDATLYFSTGYAANAALFSTLPQRGDLIVHDALAHASARWGGGPTMRVIVTGTDTDIGKTVFAAASSAALGAHYWKPIQACLDDGGDGRDGERVVALAGLAATAVVPEAYRLTTPCSPHRSAELDGVEIAPARLVPPVIGSPIWHPFTQHGLAEPIPLVT